MLTPKWGGLGVEEEKGREKIIDMMCDAMKEVKKNEERISYMRVKCINIITSFLLALVNVDFFKKIIINLYKLI